MRIALDSNVLIYAEGLNDEDRQDIANLVLDSIEPHNLVLPLQAAGETFLRMLRDAKYTRATAAARVAQWLETFEIQETTAEVFSGALDIVRRHGFGVWDSVILSAASVAGAGVLLSEDMHDGFRWRDTTIVNPFGDDPQVLVDRLTRGTIH
jgi:predicted nucleic acid-binding protein